jgi:formate dehydrogenase maturation protein FdhE
MLTGAVFGQPHSMESAMSKKLTHQQKITYINASGVRCPYCRSEDILGTSPVQMGEGLVSQNVQCNACRNHWRDVYALNDVNDAA